MNPAHFVFIGVILLATRAEAQQPHWQYYSKHISQSRNIDPLTADLFGDGIDLYSGRLSFKQTDINLSGNSDIPVALTRTFSPRDPISAAQYSWVDYPIDDEPFADWSLDIPRLGGVFAHKLSGPMLGPQGLIINSGTPHNWAGQRCSGLRVPPVVGEFMPMEYWYGIQATMPGGGELLAPNAALSGPSTSTSQRWVTTSRTSFSCLPSVKNTSGEGFLAIDTDGNRYWFDWMAQFHEPPIRKHFAFGFASPTLVFDTIYQQEMERRRSMLYVTRIEDRLGNWINYSYSNSADQPIKLDKIEANDGRRITLSYGPAGKIVSAQADNRIWTYSYLDSGELRSVTQPDGAKWSFSLNSYYGRLIGDPAAVASCGYPGKILHAKTYEDAPAVLTINHPSGAIGEFELRPRLHGRSNVPERCQAVPGSDNPDVARDYSDYVRFYWTNSLVRKKISGPGIAEMQWNYEYKQSQSPEQAASYLDHPDRYAAPGSWAPMPYTFTRLADEGKPLTDLSTYIIADPVCLSDSCAATVSVEVKGPDSWERHIFGNSYRYNERKLLRRETAEHNTSAQRVETFSYEYTGAGLPYQALVGDTRQYQGDGITEATLRPVKAMTIQQDGRVYKRVINEFDDFARPKRVTESDSQN